ncbi:A24 family peptidase [Rarobacter faecitabidus]|uniref:Leader peptidase (Prepilin peptidase)/N-methyltransferase n=1 Tax=Rarobacter faecitabidus TaxID=13243 RepID=A0A542ZW92_RARFA|nr:A24 family peptidase [Rarobacter faecitabidus]TQL64460.1 leader peptidase (prepilin peptidase)/N-methyltransferase [Rarobacter faecitabidus]
MIPELLDGTSARILATILAGVLGLVIGSFLNVVIWRVPRGESVVSPSSACPRCGHTLSWWENVPLISWVALRARCRACRLPINLRYPLVELATGVLFALVLWHFGVTFTALAFAYLGAVAIALALIDLDVHRLPDSIVLPSYIVVPVLLGAQTLIDAHAGSSELWPLWRALIGAASLFAFYFVAAIVYPGGMGLGDVKLAGLLGFALSWLGWGPLIIGAFSAFLLGGVFSGVLLLTGRASRKSGIPFGPWMLAGAMVGVMWGRALWSSYLQIFT